MIKNNKIILLISIIGTIACLISFIIAVSKAEYLTCIAFLGAGIYCFSAAAVRLKKKRK